jgi:hypothetical protein
MIHDTKHPPDVKPPSSRCFEEGECARAIEKLEQVVLDGIRHGFFDYRIVCEVINGEKRRLTITAGKSHQFVIPPEELTAQPND